MKVTPKIILGLVISFVLSAGISYAVTPADSSLLSPAAGQSGNQQIEGQTGDKTGSFSQFANEPKTEICPINGALYSKTERERWETRRPILTMIENHLEARPQSGLSLADTVYEAVAEGGITRFMGVFYCGAQADVARVAPVRSARIYFVNLAAEYNQPIYMHVGGANCSKNEASGACTTNPKVMAIEELAKMGWRKPRGNDFDTTSDIGFPVLLRDYNRLGADKVLATEHTMVGSLPAAWREAEKRGFTGKMADDSRWVNGFKAWKFDSKITPQGAPASNIKFDFWSNQPDFTVAWKYDAAQKAYLRSQGGQPHIDLDTKAQLKASAVIVQFVKEEGPLDEHKHIFYNVMSEGTGILFQGGTATEIKWKKTKQATRTTYTDKTGKEITLLPGQIWVEILALGSKVEYQ